MTGDSRFEVELHLPGQIVIAGGACGRAGELAGTLGDAAATLVEELVALNDDLAVPTLRDLGVERDHFDAVKEAMAEAALASGSPGFNPRVPEASEIVALYDRVYA